MGLVTVLVLGHAVAATAQQRRPTARPARVEIGGGVGWVGQSDVGTRDATLTSNLPGAEPDPFTFFKVIGRTRSGLVGLATVGVNLTYAIGVEGAFQYSRPELSATINADVEGAPNTTLVASTFTQTLVEGNFLYQFNPARFDNEHTVPFVFAGAGVLRQRDNDEGVEETGHLYQGGIGFKWFAQIDRRRFTRGFGLRMDVRYVLRDGGFDFSDDERRSFVAFNLATIFAF